MTTFLKLVAKCITTAESDYAYTRTHEHELQYVSCTEQEFWRGLEHNDSAQGVYASISSKEEHQRQQYCNKARNEELKIARNVQAGMLILPDLPLLSAPATEISSLLSDALMLETDYRPIVLFVKADPA